MPLSKQERLAIFFDRLDAAPMPRSADEALQLICETLDAVEDEYSGVP